MVSLEAWVGFGGVIGMVLEKILNIIEKKRKSKDEDKYCKTCGKEKVS